MDAMDNSKQIDVVAELDELVATGKASRVADKKRFIELWSQLVARDGLTKETLAYTYGTFVDAGSDALFEYLSSCGGLDPYLKLLGSPLPKSGEGVTKLFLRLMAREADSPISIYGPSFMMKRLPVTVLNAEGNISGNFSKSVKKHLVNELKGSACLGLGRECNLTRVESSKFRNLLMPELERLLSDKQLKEPVLATVKRLMIWLNSLEEDMPSASVDASIEHAVQHADDVADSLKEKHVVEKHVVEEPDVTSCVTGDVEESFDALDIEDVIGYLRYMYDSVRYLKRFRDSDNQSMEVLRQQLDEADANNREFEERLTHSETTCENLRIRNAESEAANNDLRAACEDKDALIETLCNSVEDLESQNRVLKSELDASREELSKMSEALSMVSSASTQEKDELMARLSRKLRVDYADYQDALGLEMDVDLGENMRLQLGSVFSIIKEFGVSL